MKYIHIYTIIHNKYRMLKIILSGELQLETQWLANNFPRNKFEG